MAFSDPIAEPCTVERCRREAWDIFKGVHFHNCYEIYYLEEGEIVHFVDEVPYIAHTGDFVLIAPGRVHKTLPRHGQAHTRILIYLSPDFLSPTENADLTAVFSHTLLTTANRRVAERILSDLLRESDGEADPAMMHALTVQLLISLRRWATLEVPPVSAEPVGNTERKVREMTAYLDAHFAESVGLEDLAERFYLNPTYVSRIFRRVTGTTYTEYLTKRRLQAAIALLRTTDKKVSEIAAATGFHSDNHFCKIFRRHTGVSPNTFRTTK